MGNKVKTKLGKNQIEWLILIALFRATMEQITMLTGTTQRQAKMLFNRWDKEGGKLLKVIEKTSDNDFLDKITEEIEEGSDKLRSKLSKLTK